MRDRRISLGRSASQSGFSLVELLVAVLIIGILATVFLPRMLGQKNGARNSDALHSVRIAVDAATSHFASNNESYQGFDANALRAIEPSLNGTVGAPSSLRAGPNANPRNIYIASDADGTPPTAKNVMLCAAGKGDRIYCAKGMDGQWEWAQGTENDTIQTAANGVFSADGAQGAPERASTSAAFPLFDGYSSTSFSPIYEVYQGTQTLSGGRLRLGCTTSALLSTALNLTGRSAEIEMSAPPTPASGVQMYMGVTWSGGSAYMAFHDNVMSAATYLSAWSWYASAPYNATGMRFVRLRHSSGTMHFEYSANRSSWTSLHSRAVSDALMANARIIIGCRRASGTYTDAVFDNLRAY